MASGADTHTHTHTNAHTDVRTKVISRNQAEHELTFASQEDTMAVDDIMCSPPKKRSKNFDEEAIIMGNELTDVEINFAQHLSLKH